VSPAETLILFTRFPRPGAVKTRLIPVLGPAGAAEIHRRLAERAAAAARRVYALRGTGIEVRCDGETAAVREWLGPEFRCRPQGAGDIGARMRESLEGAFAAGAGRAVLVGSDIPGLTPETLLAAFEALGGADLVFGPATDGGYYLIGARAEAFRRGTPYLDAGIDWGSSRVLAQSLGAAQTLDLNCRLLETLADADRPEDLGAALHALCKGQPADSLSVIIPALNEAGLIGSTLAALAKASPAEVLVVDGGSKDGTPGIAAAAGARVLHARPPRAIQMNAGAAAASGAQLVFLHADTRLPQDFGAQVRRTLALPGAAAGAFRLKIEGAGRGLRLIEQVANLRSRTLGLPYGDQALFLTREAFWQAGGFPSLAIMEDYALICSLRRRGRILLAPGNALTSDRRWRKLGILRTWLINQAIIAAYTLDVPPERLAAWYRSRGKN
jgi:rSAM/selenodomain-associated transferase 2/rSAM/selenodomain-associated transferase 1